MSCSRRTRTDQTWAVYTRKSGGLHWNLTDARCSNRGDAAALERIFETHPTMVTQATAPGTNRTQATATPATQELTDDILRDEASARAFLYRRTISLRLDVEGGIPPDTAVICAQDAWPVRTAKVHVSFRKKLLQQMLQAQRIFGNMVLFHCTTCNKRFPTWHTDEKFRPKFELECLRTCPVDVYEWETKPSAEHTRHASLHRGTCMGCHRSLEKVKKDQLLDAVAVFSYKNNWDPLFGLDDGAAYKEWMELSRIATVTESMLVALSHMQVSVCYLRRRQLFSSAMTGFRTNIISFPQEMLELNKLRHYWSSLEVHDIVNVTLAAAGGEPAAAPQRARIVAMQADGILVRLGDTAEEHLVQREQIQQRVTLPWKPQDLSDYFIIFRRKHGRQEEYVEDLRVRRNVIKRILKLLTARGKYREHQDVESRHYYYTAVSYTHLTLPTKA